MNNEIGEIGKYYNTRNRPVSGVPGSVTTSGFDWNLGGNYYNNENQANPNASFDPFINQDQLHQPGTTAWWVSGGPDANTPATYGAVVYFVLNFPNGQPPKGLNLWGGFNMYRPQATVATTTGTVAVDYELLKPDGITLGFGLHYGTLGSRGIRFERIIDYGNFPGTTEWLQVINSVESKGVDNSGQWTILTTNCSNVLDETDPYDYNPNSSDTPSQEVNPNGVQEIIARQDSNMWLMFTPSGGHRVPLQVVNWYWHGDAVRSGLDWNLVDQAPYNNVSPAGTDTEAYPEWTNNVLTFKNSQFQ